MTPGTLMMTVYDRMGYRPAISEAVAAVNTIVDGLKRKFTSIAVTASTSGTAMCTAITTDPPAVARRRIDRVNLEFAYHGTGEPDDLLLLPPHLGVGMGVVDVRGRSAIGRGHRRVGAAGARMIAPERIALNPDCGFAPDFGEPPTIDEAFEKLRRMCQAAQQLRRDAHGGQRRENYLEPATIVAIAGNSGLAKRHVTGLSF